MLAVDAIDLLASARVAALASLAPDGRPHIVPVVFALDGPDIVTAVDSKPKTSAKLARIANIERDPRVSVLAQSYSEDWAGLWWVRVDGRATVEEAGPQCERSLAALRERYWQYEAVALPGPAIRVAVQRVTGWRAGGG